MDSQLVSKLLCEAPFCTSCIHAALSASALGAVFVLISCLAGKDRCKTELIEKQEREASKKVIA